MKRLLGSTIAFVLVAGTPAGAHAQLVGSSPPAEGVLKEGPQRIELRFSTRTTFPEGAVRLLDRNGALIAASEKAPAGKRIRFLAPGVGEASYVVTWKVLDDDGEPSTGAYSFHVGQEAPQPPVVPPPPVVERTAEDELRDLAWTATIVGGVALLLAGGLYVLRRRRPEAATALVAGQTALACTVVAAAGLFVVGPTGETKAVAAPGEHVAKLGNGGTAKINITPPRAGSPRVEVDVKTAAGQPDFALNTARLRLVPLDDRNDIGPISFELPKRRPGYFEPELLTFPFAGRWRVELSLQRSDLRVDSITFTQEIKK